MMLRYHFPFRFQRARTKMKFLHLIVAIGILAPCCLSYTDFTTNLMTNTGLDLPSFSQYNDYLFPDLSSYCTSMYGPNMGQYSTSQVVNDYIANVQGYYLPWCFNIQNIVNIGKATVDTTLQAAFADFQSVGDEIDWGYNMINTILTNKACPQQTIDDFMSAYGNNVTMVMQYSYYLTSALGNMYDMIPSSAIYGFNSQFSYVTTDPMYQISPLKALKQIEFQFLDETTRLYQVSTDYTVWYLQSIVQGSLYATRDNVERAVDNSVLIARGVQCGP